jgi:iron complex outermembrane receptor protein
MRASSVLLTATASLLALVAPFAVTSARAADAAPEPAPAPAAAVDANGDPLGTIVVNGEKREVNLQSAAIAISTVSDDALRQRNATELADLNGFVPGLTVTKSEGNERVIAIRGVGYETAQNPNSQPGVAFHIDGVYIAHVVALNQDLLDVDHVEVLRGPQGTVFGQTSTGGAINVITRKPVLGVTTGEAQVSYGNYNYVRAMARSTFRWPKRWRCAARCNTCATMAMAMPWACPAMPSIRSTMPTTWARMSLLWQPSPDTSVTLSAQTFDADHNAALQKCLLCSTDPAAGSTTYIADPSTNPRVVNQDYGGKYNTKTRMAYLSIAQTIDDKVVLKSVTAYQYLNKNQSGDNDRYVYANYHDNIVKWQDYSSTWTQEVSASSTPNKSVEWVVGGFYLRQHALQNILEYTTGGFSTDPSNGEAVSFQTDSPYQHTSWAGYGQAIFHATDKLDLIAGARYSWDKISAPAGAVFRGGHAAHLDQRRGDRQAQPAIPARYRSYGLCHRLQGLQAQRRHLCRQFDLREGHLQEGKPSGRPKSAQRTSSSTRPCASTWRAITTGTRISSSLPKTLCRLPAARPISRARKPMASSLKPPGRQPSNCASMATSRWPKASSTATITPSTSRPRRMCAPRPMPRWAILRAGITIRA